MAGQMDYPLDGRGQRQDEHAEDGGIYAEGRRVCMRPLRSGRGITMGGTIAEAQNEATAAEIARRCAAFEPLLVALKLSRPIVAGAIAASMEGSEVREIAQRDLARIDAAIARGEGC